MENYPFDMFPLCFFGIIGISSVLIFIQESDVQKSAHASPSPQSTSSKNCRKHVSFFKLNFVVTDHTLLTL